MVINALNSGASVFMADFEDANSPTWAERRRRARRTCVDAVARTISLDTGEKRYSLNDETATLVVRPRGWHLVEKHATARRRAGQREPVRLRPLRLPLRARAARCGQRAVLLPAEARVASRGAPLARRVLARGGAARARSRCDPRDRADRDDPRRVRDGRDPPRARRARDRSQRRPLGLHLQRDQEARPPRGVPACPTAAT